MKLKILKILIIENLIFIKIRDKQCFRMCDKNNSIFEDKNYLFCSEDDSEYKKMNMFYIFYLKSK